LVNLSRIARLHFFIFTREAKGYEFPFPADGYFSCLLAVVDKKNEHGQGFRPRLNQAVK
jgi:hypothetical protein